MALRFRQSLRLWKGASIGLSIPLTRAGRGTSASGIGCITFGALAVVGLFAFLGFVGQKTHHQAPPNPFAPVKIKASTVDIGEAEPVAGPSTVATSEIPSSVESPPAVTSVVTPRVLAKGLTAKDLYSKLGLESRGFLFGDHATESQPFWTCRKTEADREYTIVMLGHSDGTISALTAEITLRVGDIEALAKNYFNSVASVILDPALQTEASSWLADESTSPTAKSFGDSTLTLAKTGLTHRRLTIQPNTQ